MIYQLKMLKPREWEILSENAHAAAFNKHKPASWDRIDFALLFLGNDVPLGYVTCREHDAETLYFQFGGSFPAARSTSLSFKGYKMAIEWTSTRYKRITTVIENGNVVMLKMAMKVGFRIVGTRTFSGQVLLELLLEH